MYIICNKREFFNKLKIARTKGKLREDNLNTNNKLANNITKNCEFINYFTKLPSSVFVEFAFERLKRIRSKFTALN